MNILKPSTWFKGAAPSVHVFCHLNPEHPHQGLDRLDDGANCVYRHAIKVTGIGMAEARIHLIGKVLDWTKLKDKHWKKIESGQAPEISFEDVKQLFR